MNPYLVAQQISFHRHNEPVFEPVDIALVAGALTVVKGANGSGKTTLMRLLAGILKTREGQLERSGIVAFVGHRPAIKNDLNCIENLEFARAFFPKNPNRQAWTPIQALDHAGLLSQTRQLAGQLSAGQRRRLGLARLLVAPADVWLLDEPYTSLDVHGCQWVDDLLDQHLSTEGSALVSAHIRVPQVACQMRQIEVFRAGEKQ